MAPTASKEERKEAKKERDAQRKKEKDLQRLRSRRAQVPGDSRPLPKIQQQPTGPATITEHIMPSPKPALRGVRKWKFPQLLDLPQELRLEIWKYTITDPSTDDLVVHINPNLIPNSPNEDPLSRRPCSPARHSSRFQRTFKTSLSKPRHHPINVAILQSSRLVYSEALPLLYHSVTFHPSDAAFTPFLSAISDVAKSHIRHVKLSLKIGRLEPADRVCWSLLCAQIALLPGLRGVEIEDRLYGLHPARNIAQKLLWPLLKIRAPKRMNPAHADDRFQVALAMAADALAAEKIARREGGEWEHVDVGRPAEEEKMEDGTQLASGLPLSDALKRAIAANLRAQDGPALAGQDGGEERDEGRGDDDGDDGASDWEVLSVANSCSKSSESTSSDRPEMVPDMRPNRTISDALRECSGW